MQESSSDIQEVGAIENDSDSIDILEVKTTTRTTTRNVKKRNVKKKNDLPKYEKMTLAQRIAHLQKLQTDQIQADRLQTDQIQADRLQTGQAQADQVQTGRAEMYKSSNRPPSIENGVKKTTNKKTTAIKRSTKTSINNMGQDLQPEIPQSEIHNAMLNPKHKPVQSEQTVQNTQFSNKDNKQENKNTMVTFHQIEQYNIGKTSSVKHPIVINDMIDQNHQTNDLKTSIKEKTDVRSETGLSEKVPQSFIQQPVITQSKSFIQQPVITQSKSFIQHPVITQSKVTSTIEQSLVQQKVGQERVVQPAVQQKALQERLEQPSNIKRVKCNTIKAFTQARPIVNIKSNTNTNIKSNTTNSNAKSDMNDKMVTFTVLHNNKPYSHTLNRTDSLKSVYSLYCDNNIKLSYNNKIVSKFSSLNVLKINNGDTIETWDCEHDVSTNTSHETSNDLNNSNEGVLTDTVYCYTNCTESKSNVLKINYSQTISLLLHYHKDETLNELIERINLVNEYHEDMKMDCVYKILVRNGEKITGVHNILKEGDCLDTFS
ncbi:hypothetical protein M153_2641000109 [Pseudoloma neurophilia]|uniref:Ubiquitin-like domain-containing protein n=1 Tax=Pseudoloma neurophilia TaxID=146866 RepID=A0A0R0LZL8_9MICR|nr:hypothetical protein M153_2641000109 [Pseudoloma neurophilia]